MGVSDLAYGVYERRLAKQLDAPWTAVYVETPRLQRLPAQERGRILKTPWAPKLLATLHPSAVLRAEDRPGQERLYGFLLTDLKLVAAELSPRA